MSQVLMMLFAFAVPWEYSLDLGQPFGNVARIMGLLLLLAVALGALARGGWRAPGALQWLVLALYLYFVLSYLWTVDPSDTIDKMRAYFQVMMVVWLFWEVAQTVEDFRTIVRAFVAGCWVLAGLTILDFLAAGAAQQARFAAEGQDPNDVARFLDLGFPLATLLFATDTNRLARTIAFGYLPVGLLGVLLTASRGGFFAAMVALLGSAMLLVRWRPRAASAVFLGLAATAALLWMFVPVESLDRLATIPQAIGSGDLNERQNIWISGVRAFAHAPLWGSGAGSYTAAAGLAAGDTAHNTILAILVTGGLAGLALFIAVLASLAWAAAKMRGLLRIAISTLLLVWGIASMVGSVEENRATWLMFALIGLAARLAAEEPGAMAQFTAGRAGRRRLRPVAALP